MTAIDQERLVTWLLDRARVHNERSKKLIEYGGSLAEAAMLRARCEECAEIAIHFKNGGSL